MKSVNAEFNRNLLYSPGELSSIRPMVRAVTAYIVCCILAPVSVSGAHVHAHGFEHDHGVEHDHGLEHHDVTEADADHLDDHAHHHAVDVDRQAKAFGLHLSAAPVALVALWYGFLTVDLQSCGSVISFPPPLRPPRNLSRFFIIPPSQAPPTLLI